MTKNDYIKQVAHLPKEEQIQILENLYEIEGNKDSSSDEVVTLCELLAFEYEVFKYKIILPDIYFEAGYYKKAIELAQSHVNELKGAGCCDFYHLIGMSYEKIGNYEEALLSYSRAADSMLVMLSHGGTQEINFSALPEQTLYKLSSYFALTGNIWFRLEQYSNALRMYAESYKYYRLTDVTCNLGLICCDGLEVTKDVKKAEEFFLQIANNTTQNPDVLEYIAKANYKLGIIYSKEYGFVNRENAEARLKRAQSCGYPISDSEIQQILSSIPQPKKKSFFSFFK